MRPPCLTVTSLLHTHSLCSSRAQSNFPNRVKSGDKQGRLRYVAGNSQQHQPVGQAESTAEQHADRPSGQQAHRLNEAQAARDSADGSEHDAASKYRRVEKSKRQSYRSDLMQPCERSAADREMVNREAIDRNIAQCVYVSGNM